MSSHLPEELVDEMLLRFSVRDLHRFKCVCRGWKDLINSQSFIHKYENNSREKFVCFSDKGFCLLDVKITESESELEKLDFPLESMTAESTIALHCRGLLCVTLKNHSLVVWDPSSKKFKIIPNDNIYRDSNILGFGYDRFVDDYKIVTFVDRLDASTAYIFELKSNSWKESLLIPSPNWYYRDRKGKLLDRNLYWIAYRSKQDRFILCFDFTTQKQQELHFPTPADGSRRSWLGVMGRNLCVIEYVPRNEEIGIWIKERTAANDKTWTNFITVSTMNVVSGSEWSDCHVDFVCFTKKNDLLVTFTKKNDSTGSECMKKKVFLCKTEDKAFEEVRFCDSVDKFRFLDGYAESLASTDFYSL